MLWFSYLFLALYLFFSWEFSLQSFVIEWLRKSESGNGESQVTEHKEAGGI